MTQGARTAPRTTNGRGGDSRPDGRDDPGRDDRAPTLPTTVGAGIRPDGRERTQGARTAPLRHHQR